ncbi:hypothetical protein ACFXTH_022003 [Malus domestica]
MNSVRVVGKSSLNLNYIHMRRDNRTSEPEVGISLDISHSVLDVALENEVDDDLLLRDMGQSLGFRSGVIDGAISISAAACSDPDYPPQPAPPKVPHPSPISHSITHHSLAHHKHTHCDLTKINFSLIISLLSFSLSAISQKRKEKVTAIKEVIAVMPIRDYEG